MWLFIIDHGSMNTWCIISSTISLCTVYIIIWKLLHVRTIIGLCLPVLGCWKNNIIINWTAAVTAIAWFGMPVIVYVLIYYIIINLILSHSHTYMYYCCTLLLMFLDGGRVVFGAASMLVIVVNITQLDNAWGSGLFIRLVFLLFLRC